MDCIVYTQDAGFGALTTLAAVGIVDWADEHEEPEQWFDAAGFDPDQAGFVGDPANGHPYWLCRAHYGAKHGFAAVCVFEGRWDIVLVRSPADLIALEIALAPLVTAVAVKCLVDHPAENVLGKLFQASHGHPPDDHCRHCDPARWHRDHPTLPYSL